VGGVLGDLEIHRDTFQVRVRTQEPEDRVVAGRLARMGRTRISMTVTIETTAGLRPVATSRSSTCTATGCVASVASRKAASTVVSSSSRSPSGIAATSEANVTGRYSPQAARSSRANARTSSLVP
jgi:hypothetical protein